ncbi:SWI/SNF complex subunit SWI3D isoform X1 [Oryza sativa Japonica Group]|uniref:SWI/SNF complex subunit SWI3D isoform X1 n=1 Tax=Oryza sativa subsp. japonica TaxID=39947 RepID=UPI00077556E4|nr:SWI/SNF complex subunit SWI3D isoform X1 [Oryza sativa Japonica Group]
MEPKSSASAAHQGGDAPAEAPRRRGGGGKRKSGGSSFTPSKRHAKERNAAFHVPPHLLHSGPLTRAARQSPHKLAEEAAAAAAAGAGGSEAGGGKGGGDVIRLEGEEAPTEETPLVDEVFEAVRSRGAGVHVVPTFAGWFSWKEIHPIEKQMLPSFFNGKSDKRTPEIYLGIRNFIMLKFHANPQLQLESKDLAELSIGEADAHQEVLKFLDHWGLINFHPFLPAGQEESKPEEAHGKSHSEEKASVLEQLFKFESVQSYMIPLPKKGEVETPAPLPSLLPDPALIEDVVSAAEPSVEYHCNSCSVDCSKKRYHCRTQADFDLCSDCYNEGKFNIGMAKTDFILMDSSEVSGASGTSWTDEETLLLLEALEIFGGKWTEIAEHVATKTKAQCMLHFLQMQIEDRFHGDEDINQNIQENTEQASAEKGAAEIPDKMEVEEKAEGKDTAGEKTPEKAEGNSVEAQTEDGNAIENKDANNSGGTDSVKSLNTDEPKKSSDADPPKSSSDAEPVVKENSVDVDTSRENASNFAIDTLKSAFEAVGYFPEHEGSFADAGNPVMALASFLAGLVEDDTATNSCRSSLKAISEVSPALQLATRHCFILEDPPSDVKDMSGNASTTSTDGDKRKDKDKTQDSIDSEVEGINKKGETVLSVEGKKSSPISPKGQDTDKKDECDEDPSVDPKHNNGKESDDPVSLDKSVSNNKKGINSSKDSVTPLNITNQCGMITSQGFVTGNTMETSNPEMIEDKASSEVNPADDSSLEGKVEMKKTKDAVANATTAQEQKQSQILENGKMEEPKSTEDVAADEENSSRVTANLTDSITRLKRAAATAISAAAVKAKLLADHEEEQVRQLAALMIDKLYRKVEAKVSFLTEVEHLVQRTREYTEKTRKKLLMERNAIIAARMGSLPSRPNQPGAAGNRLPAGYGGPIVRPPPNAMPRPSS